MNTRSLFVASGIAGVVMALLSSLPVIKYGNCFVCMWLWASGMLGVWLYCREEGSATPGEGAVVGLTSGFIGAILAAVLNTIFGGAGLASMLASELNSSEDRLGGVLGSFAVAGTFSLMGLLFNLFIYPVFGAIGGAISGVVFGKKTTT